MAILLFRPISALYLGRNTQDEFQSPWWRFFFLDCEQRRSFEQWRWVSVALVAILLFRLTDEDIDPAANLSFSRLGGDSSF